jgi:hypothetical protein
MFKKKEIPILKVPHIAYVPLPIFAAITYVEYIVIIQWPKLIGLLMVSYYYQAMIRKGGVEFATFSANWKQEPVSLTNIT